MKTLTLSRNNATRTEILRLAKEKQKPPSQDGIGPEGQPPVEPKC
jgi:hypothetical protein